MTEENTNIHESDTGIQAFDVTPPVEHHEQPNQETQPEQQGQQERTPYDLIIEQQNAQIDALMKHTERLNAQIAQMVQGGVQFTDNQVQQSQSQQAKPMQQSQSQQAKPMQQFNPDSLSDNIDYSLEALGREIGKPNKPDA